MCFPATSTNVGAGLLPQEFATGFRRATHAFLMSHVARAIYRLRCLKLREQELLGLISAGRCWTLPPVRRLVAYATSRVMRWTCPFEMAHSTLLRLRLDYATCRMSKAVWRNSQES